MRNTLVTSALFGVIAVQSFTASGTAAQSLAPGTFNIQTSGSLDAQIIGAAAFTRVTDKSGQPALYICLNRIGDDGTTDNLLISQPGLTAPKVGKFMLGKEGRMPDVFAANYVHSAKGGDGGHVYLSPQGSMDITLSDPARIQGTLSFSSPSALAILDPNKAPVTVRGSFDAIYVASCQEIDNANSAGHSRRTAAPVPAAAQITGFSSIPWGSSRAAIVDRYGKPALERQDGGVLSIVYQERLMGEDVTTLYSVHPKEGLIRGGYSVPFGMGSACEDTYDKFRRAVAERYPSIRPTGAKVNTSTLDFCGGVRIGKGRAEYVWEDPTNKSRVLVQLPSEGDRVYVLYSSAFGVQWTADRAEAERNRRF